MKLFKNSSFNAGVAFSNAAFGIWFGVGIANNQIISIPLIFLIVGCSLAGLSVLYNNLDK